MRVPEISISHIGVQPPLLLAKFRRFPQKQMFGSLNACSSTINFGGTSAAAPLATGIITLALEAKYMNFYYAKVFMATIQSLGSYNYTLP